MAKSTEGDFAITGYPDIVGKLASGAVPASGLNANANSNGNVNANGDDWNCNVNNDGKSNCNDEK